MSKNKYILGIAKIVKLMAFCFSLYACSNDEELSFNNKLQRYLKYENHDIVVRIIEDTSLIRPSQHRLKMEYSTRFKSNKKLELESLNQDSQRISIIFDRYNRVYYTTMRHFLDIQRINGEYLASWVCVYRENGRGSFLKIITNRPLSNEMLSELKVRPENQVIKKISYVELDYSYDSISSSFFQNIKLIE